MNLNKYFLACILTLSTSTVALCSDSDKGRKRDETPSKTKHLAGQPVQKKSTPSREGQILDLTGDDDGVWISDEFNPGHTNSAASVKREREEQVSPDNRVEKKSAVASKPTARKLDALAEDAARINHNQDPEALERLRAAAAPGQPERGRAQFFLGMHAYNQNKALQAAQDAKFDPQYKAAFTLFLQATQNKIGYWEAQEMLGLIYKSRGDLDSAREYFELAIETKESKTSLFELALLCKAKNNLEEVYGYLDRAIKAKHPEALITCAELIIATPSLHQHLDSHCELLRNSKHAQAREWLCKALFLRAHEYEQGLNASVNVTKSIELLTEAALLGSEEAKQKLASSHTLIFKSACELSEDFKDISNCERAVPLFEQVANDESREKLSQLYALLGKHYRGKAESLDKAKDLLQKAVQAGNKEAFKDLGAVCLDLGKLHESQENPNYVMVRENYEVADKAGIAEAKYRLSQLYEQGLGVARNLAKAFDLIDSSARAGCGMAGNALPEFKYRYAKERILGTNIKQDLVHAAQLLKEAKEGRVADQEHLEHALLCAQGRKCFEMGDLANAVILLTKAKEHNSEAAEILKDRARMLALAGITPQQKPGNPQEANKVNSLRFEIAKIAAHNGCVASMLEVAAECMEGKLALKNKIVSETRKYLEMAAKAGSQDAQTKLDQLYLDKLRGDLVIAHATKDLSEIIKKLEPLETKGIEGAKAVLGLARTKYAQGLDATNKHVEATGQYLLAARAGDTHAQERLATRYFEGKGCKKNVRKAHEWAEKAVSVGDKSISKVLPQIKVALAKEVLASEKASVEEIRSGLKLIVDSDMNTMEAIQLLAETKFRLANILNVQDQGDRENAEIETLLEEAFAAGHKDAGEKLVELLFKEKNNFEKLKRGVEIAHRLGRSMASLVNAQLRLGKMYFKGLHGAPKDKEQAKALFKSVSEAGLVEGHYNYGVAIAKDNPEEAARLFGLAAGDGHEAAVYAYAARLKDGKGIAQDSLEALRLLLSLKTPKQMKKAGHLIQDLLVRAESLPHSGSRSEPMAIQQMLELVETDLKTEQGPSYACGLLADFTSKLDDTYGALLSSPILIRLFDLNHALKGELLQRQGCNDVLCSTIDGENYLTLGQQWVAATKNALSVLDETVPQDQPLDIVDFFVKSALWLSADAAMREQLEEPGYPPQLNLATVGQARAALLKLPQCYEHAIENLSWMNKGTNLCTGVKPMQKRKLDALYRDALSMLRTHKDQADKSLTLLEDAVQGLKNQIKASSGRDKAFSDVDDFKVITQAYAPARSGSISGITDLAE